MTIVFLDRDGVINENRPNDYVRRWNEFVFIPKAKEALRRLAENREVKIFIVSNQAGVGKALLSAAQVEEINQRMKNEIEIAGGRIDGILYCPHTAEEKCLCRKPEADLLLRVLEEIPGYSHKRFIVGDAVSDMEAGRKVSAVSIMVKTGRGQDELKSIRDDDLKPDYVAEDIAEAAEIILRDVGHSKRCPTLHLEPR